ncbi:MAG: hypothetical protein J7545_14800 [Roseofilum sp. SBFL]|uniref:hypothetical protein n=1 Tax=unclassified Roseofilum TaxID=2620099 RepID=UPI001B1AE46D|nr:MULTISPECIES: hypothetical protein [unclassified Roseofilum]MBP0013401.1 hypothetical protein [Roseofilum sp. SID3]MBP0022861.1 hypothetical protein [Roseofilum sp. SID2]MBP0036340.1 hypothetical protein [Roseofilum sp. SID1]MBP0043218.1 hypothetical protein [Roseofilum sp. SBFL]
MISTIIEDRSQIWQKYDQASQQQQELASYSGQFNDINTSENIPLLTDAGTPPDELAASVWQLKQYSDQIKQSQANIEQYQTEIAAVKKQFFIIVGIAVLIISIALYQLVNR